VVRPLAVCVSAYAGVLISVEAILTFAGVVGSDGEPVVTDHYVPGDPDVSW
jgi:hypothetical protein